MPRWDVLIAGVVLLGMSGLVGTAAASSYEEIAIRNCGSITGKISLTGPIPDPRVFPLVLYPFGPFCKKISDGRGNILLEEFIVGSEGGMQDAVVAVQQVKRGKAFPPIENEFVVVNCMFHPADVPDNELFEVSGQGKLHHDHPLVTVLENHRPI